MLLLRAWADFYVIVGSAAGALIGLQFVVMTLIADAPSNAHSSSGQAAASAFGTPTVVHLSTCLLLAGMFAAPWPAFGAVEWCWAAVGVVGCAYEMLTGLRMRRQAIYTPVLEDWLLFLAVPLAAFATLIVTAWLAAGHEMGALFGAAAAVLALLFAAIRNAWDTITYHVYNRRAT